VDFAAANATCALQFFYGNNHQGHQLTDAAPILLGEQQVTTDGSGSASFSLSFATPAGLTGGWVTATATDAAGNTSEFADCIQIERSNCIFLLSPTSQSFKASGGTGRVNVSADSNCGWAAARNADWITIAPGSTGKGNGAVNYSVAAYDGQAARTGTLKIAEQVVTVVQAGTDPVIIGISTSGKHLIVTGESFDSGAVILLNGERQKTLHDDSTTLRGKDVARQEGGEEDRARPAGQRAGAKFKRCRLRRLQLHQVEMIIKHGGTETQRILRVSVPPCLIAFPILITV
jgi:Viral BACON domain